jgi:intein/homing endonuclease
MITKLVYSDSFDYDDTSSVVRVHSRGVDRQWQQKHASSGVFAQQLADLRPKPGHTVIHVIALGDEETWGPNRNCDGFSREDNVERHKTFVDLGHVFRNHKNSDPDLSVGRVIGSAHNDLMSRVELLLELVNDKCEREVQALESGKDVPVSMGCFTAGHKLTLDDGSTILLEHAQLGDRVLTHTGAHYPITHVFEKAPYTGRLYKLSARTVEDIEATEEHPFFVVRAAQIGHTGYKTFRLNYDALAELDVPAAAEWVAAKDLEVGDYLVTPVNMTEELPDYMSVALARLLGYYAAEGHVRMTPAGRFCSVCFSVNRADAAVEEIPRRCAELGISPNCIRVNDSTSSQHAVAITVTDSELAYRCADLCGQKAKQKRLSQELMLLPMSYQLEFLGALINGDGCAGTGSQTGALYISTAYTFYRDQLRHLLARVGVTPGVNTITHRAGVGKSTYSTVEFQVYVPKTDASVLAPYTVKGVRDETTGRRGGRRVRVGDFILTPIDAIQTRDVQDEPIFNIEVACDNSYVINGIAVHNSLQDYDVCSFCGHKAPTAKDHCRHIQDHLGEVLEDGTRIYMKNPKPKYFDISLVFKPADRIAYTLRKVALTQGVVGGHELASAAGLGDWNAKTAVMQTLARQIKIVRGKGMKIPLDDLGERSRSCLKQAAARYGVEELLSLLSRLGVLLSGRDFSDVIVGHPCPEACGAALEDGPSFDDLMEDHTEIKAFESPNRPSSLSLDDDTIRELISCGSLDQAPVQQRVIRLTIIARPKLAAALPPVEVDALRRLYAHYKLAWAAQRADDPIRLKRLAATF